MNPVEKDYMKLGKKNVEIWEKVLQMESDIKFDLYTIYLCKQFSINFKNNYFIVPRHHTIAVGW